jgi:hypothetical protein
MAKDKNIYKFGLWIIITVIVSFGTTLVALIFFNTNIANGEGKDIQALSDLYQVVIGFLTVIIGILGFIVYKNSANEAKNYIYDIYEKDSEKMLKKILEQDSYIDKINDLLLRNNNFNERIKDRIDTYIDEIDK